MDERWRYAPCGILGLDYGGNLLEVNATFLKEMGYEQESLIGKHIEYLLKPGARMIFHTYFYPSINMYGSVNELFVKLKNKEGEEVPYLINARQYKPDGDNGKIDIVLLPMRQRMAFEQELNQTKRQLEGVLREREAALQQLETLHVEIQSKQEALSQMNTDLVLLSNTDYLTGIQNRKFLQEKLDALIAQGNIFSLLIIDIDHFKKVNDVYGHLVGDDVLIEVAHLLKNHTKRDHYVARYGGEEFVILLSAESKEEALLTAKHLNAIIASNPCKKIDSLTVSIGVATFNKGENKHIILEKADQALYYAKENGRNRVTHYSDLIAE